MRVLRTLARNLWTNGFTRALFQRDRRVDCKRSIILLCDHLDVHFSFLAQLTENDDPASRTRLTHHPVVVLISPHLHPAIRTIHLRGASFPRLHLFSFLFLPFQNPNICSDFILLYFLFFTMSSEYALSFCENFFLSFQWNRTVRKEP